MALTLLTETRVNVEEYVGHSKILLPVMNVDCKCQTDTENTGGNAYGHPQAVAERCNVAIPCQVGVPGQTYKDVEAEMQIYCRDSVCQMK